MKNFNYEEVENKIGFCFNNKKLLKQAFIRSSYAQENGRPSNEVLDFIGDKVLDIVVIRILLGGKEKTVTAGRYFRCKETEGNLSKMKAEIVNSNNLSKAIDELGLERFIFYGKSDLNNDLANKKSIKEDLFEAIVGATALDSNWDMDVIYDKVIRLFRNIHKIKEGAAKNSNYTGLLQERVSKIGLEQPTCVLTSGEKGGIKGWFAEFEISNLVICKSFGLTQKEAKKNAAKGMLSFLDEHEKELLEKKSLSFDVFSYINQMVQRKIIHQPTFKFKETHDNNGNPVWTCEANIDETLYIGSGSSQKLAKEEALMEALETINDKLLRTKPWKQ